MERLHSDGTVNCKHTSALFRIKLDDFGILNKYYYVARTNFNVNIFFVGIVNNQYLTAKLQLICQSAVCCSRFCCCYTHLITLPIFSVFIDFFSIEFLLIFFYISNELDLLHSLIGCYCHHFY